MGTNAGWLDSVIWRSIKKKVGFICFFFRTRVSIHFQFSHIGEKRQNFKKKVPPQGNICRKANILDFSSGLL